MSLSDEVAELRRLLPELRALQGGGVHQIMMQPPDSGERAVHRIEKANYLLIGLLLGVTFAGWALISETRKDIQTERIERKMHEIWAVQEASTMRTFAKTGVLAPMEPRPNPKEATK
jgi:hypothetical protein